MSLFYKHFKEAQQTQKYLWVRMAQADGFNFKVISDFKDCDDYFYEIFAII